MNLQKDILEPNRYEYLSKEDSLLYTKVKDSKTTNNKIIKKLLEDKAGSSRAAHCQSRY